MALKINYAVYYLFSYYHCQKRKDTDFAACNLLNLKFQDI